MPVIWWAVGVVTVGIIALTKKNYQEIDDVGDYIKPQWNDMSLIEKFNYFQNLEVKKLVLILSGSYIILKLFQTSADIYKTSKR